MSGKTPVANAAISTDDIDMIFDAVLERQQKNPSEPAKLSFYLVISGIGDRFRKVQCLEQEWEGLKKDIPFSIEAPVCPNGHTLNEGPGLYIGWVPQE